MPIHPDPITRNRRERRLAWVLFALLLGLAAIGGWPGAANSDSVPARVEQPAEAP